MPPTTQTKNTMGTVPTLLIIVCGTRKMPLPITVPITIASAARSPRSRLSSVGLVMPCPISSSRNDERRQISHSKSGAAADHDPPCERNSRREFHVEHGCQAGNHSGNGGVFSRLLCQHAKQKQAQQDT